ncbi:MAG: hypothetical protein MO846_01460 [Candidatus Devosia symbiotica]|nr:hypothetical protein [Candidatus Devosia symbiotica]
MRLNSSLVDAVGVTSLRIEGLLSSGTAPRFDGTMTYRQTPLIADNADEIRGDLVLESKMIGSTDRIVLTRYTLQPDQS